jgi:hypothetical protein
MALRLNDKTILKITKIIQHQYQRFTGKGIHYQEMLQATKWQLSFQNESNALLWEQRRAWEWLAKDGGNFLWGYQNASSETAQSLWIRRNWGEQALATNSETPDVPTLESLPLCGPAHNALLHPLLNPTVGATLLLSFYTSKIPHLIVPYTFKSRCVHTPIVDTTVQTFLPLKHSHICRDVPGQTWYSFWAVLLV